MSLSQDSRRPLRQRSSTLGPLLVVGALLLVTNVGLSGEDTAPGTEVIAVTDVFQPFLEKSPVLWQGGWRTFSDETGWVVLAVGLAPLRHDDGQPVSVQDAAKVARANAGKEMIRAIQGIKLSAEESGRLSGSTPGGSTRVREYFRAVSREQMDATLRGTEPVGSWYIDEKRYLAVMIALGSPGNPLLQAKATSKPSGVKFRNVQMEARWREVFRSRAGILTGGAALYRKQNETLLLVVGRAQLDSSRPAAAKLVTEATAAKELVQFVQGLKLSAWEESATEQVHLAQEERALYQEVKETIQSMSAGRVRGIAQALSPVGTWESTDGQYLYQGFVARLSEIETKKP